jgi:UTP-glucose-1-phosphate uridylyltransferase
MAPTLLVLAAGLGSRYGGLKQLDPVGPSGEILLDYAVFDAMRAGFQRVVFVIREEFAAEFRLRVVAKYAPHLEVDCVFQAPAALPAGCTVPPGREKPWGTGHAVWCARAALPKPFAVIGADDFFGRDAFVQLAAFFSEIPNSRFQIPIYAMVGYQLANTLSEHGAVARGLCTVGVGGRLNRVIERTNLRPEDVGPGREFSGRETVSMNCWAFTPELFPMLEMQFRAFLHETPGGAPPNRGGVSRGGDTPPASSLLKAEFYLPEAVSGQIAAGAAEVEVRPTAARWFGVTYRDDKPRVQSMLAALQAAGEYPQELFPA